MEREQHVRTKESQYRDKQARATPFQFPRDALGDSQETYGRFPKWMAEDCHILLSSPGVTMSLKWKTNAS